MEPKDPNVYVISLDAIELNLLPSIYCAQDNRVEPLWNSNLDRSSNECYQFQINSTDGGKVKEPSKPELENVICHICDIEVPKPFLIEHSKSSRHKTNLKISEIAVNRMQKHLNSTRNENSSDIDKMDTSMYFCANCVTVMDRKDKETHEKTLSHKNSVVFEKIFHEFLILYDSNENGNNEMEKINENVENDCTDNVSKGNDSYTNVCKKDCISEKSGNNFHIDQNNGNDFKSENNANSSYSSGTKETFFYGSGCDIYNNKNNGNDIYTNKRNENDGYTHKKNENDGYTSQNEEKFKIITNTNDSTSNFILKKPFNTSKKDTLPKESTAKRVSTNDYMSLLNRRKDGLMNFKLSADCDTIEIETIDGSIVKVSEENFHSFNKVGKKHIQCFVCKEIFKGSAVEAHKMSEKHIKLMVAPLRDKHCARQIDDRLSHCLICNAVMKESGYHALCDDDHSEYLKAALVSDKVTEDYDQYTAKCLTSNKLDEDKRDEDCIDNRKEKVENDENVKENDDWIEVSKNNIKAKVKANTTETNIIPTKYFCASCNRFVYYSLKHNETANHIWNLKSDYHYLMKLEKGEVYCQVCKVPVTDDPDELKVIKNHVHSEEHVEKYNQILVNNKIERFKRHFYCSPCNRVILIKNELKHTSEKRHKRFSAVKCNAEVIQQHEIDKITEKADDYKTETNKYQAEKMLLEDYVCNICNVKVPNYERNIQEHMNGKSHVANVEKKPQVTSEESEITDINYQMELTKFPNVLNCLMCKVYILHNELSVSEHLNHTLHKMNYNIFLKDNNMVLRDNNCYCNTCKVFVGIRSEILHAFGRKHIKKQKLELATLIELKNAKDKDIRNLKPFASNNLQKQNIATSSESINEDEQNIGTPTVSPNEDKQNIATPSVSTNEDKQKIVTSSVSTIEDDTECAKDEYEQNMVTAYVVINDEDEKNIVTVTVSSNDDKQNIATPFMSTNEDKQNTATTSVSTNQYKQSAIESNQNIAKPSSIHTEDKQNIVTTFMSNLYADTFPPFIFDENFAMLKDLYRHGVGPNVVSMIKDYYRLRTDPDIINQIRDRDPNVVKNINKEDQTNITTPSESTTENKQNIVTIFMCNLYADTFPPFIFDDNFAMLKDLYRHGVGPNVVSMIKDNRLRTDPDIINQIRDRDPNVVRNINKEDQTNITTPSESTTENKQNIVTIFMCNLYADTFPPFIFDENFPLLKDLYRHGAGPNIVSMIKDHKRIRNDSHTLKLIPDCNPNVVKYLNEDENIATPFVSVKKNETIIPMSSVSTYEDKQNIATPSVSPNVEQQNIATPFVSVKEDETIIPMPSESTNEEKQNIATSSVFTNEEKQNIVTPSVSPNAEKQNISTPFVFVKENETIISMPSVFTNEDKQNIATPSVSTNAGKQNIATPFVSIKEDEIIIPMPSVSTNEEKQNIVTPSVSPNAEKQNIATPFVSIKEDETIIPMPSVSTNEEKQNIAMPFVSIKEDEKIIPMPSVSTNEEKQNIAMPFLSIKEDETIIPMPSVSTNEEKQNIAMPFVAIKEDEKIIPMPSVYTNEEKQNIATSSVSTNEEKQNIAMPFVSIKEDEKIIPMPSVYTNAEKQNIATPFLSVKEDETNIATTSVPLSNKIKGPCIDSNVSKIMNDPNVTKNINNPSVSYVKTVNASSLTPKSVSLALGGNPGLPVTMLELLEPTANSKEVICKICKVTVPYTKSNVSTHINGPKHKNEHQKSLKSDIKCQSTSSVVRDNRPCIDSNASKVVIDCNTNMAINIPSVPNVKVNASSLTPQSDALVLGKNPGLPVTMLELLEPTANSKVVICKICKVNVPYSKSNVSTHIKGSKHKNEYQKSLKSDIKYPNTSSIIRDNIPCIGSNASKVMNDSNVTKNIPSVSNVKKVNDSSLQSKSDVLVLGENIGLPETMLELLLLEPTANSKEVICKICKVKVPYNLLNVSSHVNGSNHKNALKKVLKAT